MRPAREIDPLYAAALQDAHAAGVEILAYGAQVTLDGLFIDRRLPVLLD